VQAPEDPPSEAELTLLAPLHEGSELAGYAVEHIGPVHDGAIRIECKRGETAVKLDVFLASPDAPPPPAQSGRYAVYYTAPAATQDGARVSAALASVLDANASAPGPTGLLPFHPH
jgi:hypothetical protein